MTHLTLKDDLLDGQVLRALGAAPYGGADVGEVLTTARRVKGTDLDSWYSEWSATAQRVSDLAEAASEDGNRETARLAYLRACTYFRMAGAMLMGAPTDQRLVDAYEHQTDAFRRAGELMTLPPEEVEIPFEGRALPGYFLRCADDGLPRATVLLLGGYDSTMEESYFFNGAAALARGYNVLMFDGPGQGAALLRLGLHMRPDWENVIRPVVDCLDQRSEVDSERIALIGLSLGGHLAPRAASGEHRLAACIADCGAFDMYAAFLDRLPGPVRSGFEAGHKAAVAAVREMLDLAAKQPTAGWSLRRGFQVHGVATPLDLIEAMKDYSLAERAAQITCPTFVCNAEGDDISASAPELVAALTCEHEFVTFTAAEGAGDHCEAGARTLYHARSFDWLDRRLRPRDVVSSSG